MVVDNAEVLKKCNFVVGMSAIAKGYFILLLGILFVIIGIAIGTRIAAAR